MGNSSFVSLALTDNIDNKYIAGDTINGVVYVDLKENRRVNSLEVKLRVMKDILHIIKIPVHV